MQAAFLRAAERSISPRNRGRNLRPERGRRGPASRRKTSPAIRPQVGVGSMLLPGRRHASSSASRTLSGGRGAMCAKQPLVQVGVFDPDGKCLEHAHVRLEPEQAGSKARPLRWDRSRGCYLASGVAAGRHRLIAQALGYGTAERRVEVETAGLRTVILVGPASLPFLYRGQVKTPFRPQSDLLAIALDENMSKDAVTKLDKTAEQEGLVSQFVDLNGQPPRHARVFRFPSGISDAPRREIVRKLVAMAGVHPLGPLVHFDRDESVSCLTDELVIRFRAGVTRAQVDELAE